MISIIFGPLDSLHPIKSPAPETLRPSPALQAMMTPRDVVLPVRYQLRRSERKLEPQWLAWNSGGERKTFPKFQEKKQMLPEKNGGKLCLFHEWLDLFPPFFLSRIMGTCGYQVLWLAASSKQLQSLLTKNSYKSKQKSYDDDDDDDDDDDVFPVGMPGWVQTKFGKTIQVIVPHAMILDDTSLASLLCGDVSQPESQQKNFTWPSTQHQQTAPKMPSNNMKKRLSKTTHQKPS